jgi:hypothetical protein
VLLYRNSFGIHCSVRIANLESVRDTLFLVNSLFFYVILFVVILVAATTVVTRIVAIAIFSHS